MRARQLSVVIRVLDTAAIPVRLASVLLPGGAPSVVDGTSGAPDADEDDTSSPRIEPPLAELLELLDDGAELIEDVVEEGVDLVQDSVGLHRRVWEDDDLDRVEIEVPAIADPDADGLRRRFQRSLSRFEGVRWAEVNAITSRIAVAFDGGAPTLAGLLELIESIEEAAGVGRSAIRPSWDVEERADHPSDAEPIHRTIAIIAGDVASLGWTAVGRAARLARLPVEVAGIVTVVDNHPWLRERAQRILGRRSSALVLPLVASAANGIAQGFYGTIVDLGYQAAVLGELRARRQAWSQREPEFYAVHNSTPIEPPDLPPRPGSLPDGPIERVAAGAGGLGLLAGAGTFAVTRDPRLATDLLLAATPKAASLGREGFAAMLGRTLAQRQVVPLDASALRRLDRIDTVVLDADVLVADALQIRAVARPDGAPGDERVMAMAERLFDPDAPDDEQRWRDARLLPPREVDHSVLRAARGTLARIREIRAEGGQPMVLLLHEQVVAVLHVGPPLDAGAASVVAAVRNAGLQLVVADTDGRTARRLDADHRFASGPGLGDAVRRLQQQGCGVMVVGRQGHRGLAAADVGVGIVAPTGRPSWGADLILGRELAEAVTLVAAVPVAREVSRRAARFAAGGSALAALVVLSGPRVGAGSRALAVINVAAGASLVSGLWSGVLLAHEPRPRSPDRSRWHALPSDRVLRHLASDGVRGLTSDKVAQRAAARRPADAEISPLEPFLAELANPLNPVLAVGAGLSAAAGSMSDAGLVIGLIGVNTLVGGVQRLRAERNVQGMLSDDVELVTVARDGEEQRVRGDRLVRGDVMELSAGEALPADARVLEVDACEVDESSLTGESLPVTKEVDPAPDATVGERSCMLYEGTTVVAGKVRAVVVATGAATEVSRGLALSGPPPRTGVELRLDELTRRLLPGAMAVAGATGAVGLLRRWPVREVAGTAVSLAIASVPEGLPFVATAGQLAGARRLAATGAVVRNPRTVEALGRVDVLCVDKTGTLTEGRVALVGISDGRRAEGLEGLDAARRHVLATAVLASEQPSDNGRLIEQLDDADRALHTAAVRIGFDAGGELGGWSVIDDLPFEASRGVHAVLGRSEHSHRIVVKGAPEAVLAACERWHLDGDTIPLDEERRAHVHAHVTSLARRGNRLLAVATTRTREDAEVEAEDLTGLVFLGLVVLSDPVRATAASAVAAIAEAGVRTIMVTGDHPETATSIAAELGLPNADAAVTGSEIETLDDAGLVTCLERTHVVARVTPAQKQRIVEVLQGAGRVVAMTGDGANDAAAIRLAQVGVALGTRSSAAARDAADIVVTDDRVETLIDAIAEGRALWGSIREALAVLVGGNLGEIGFTSIASAFSDRAPLHPRQFLLVNLFTDLAPAVAIAVRPPEDTSGAMLHEGPDRSLGDALRRDIAVRGTATALGATAAWAAARVTGTQRRASTVGLAALVGTQLGQTLVAGGWRRPTTLLTVAGSAGAFFFTVQTPVVSHFFGSRPLGPVGWSQAAWASVAATVGSQVGTRLLAALDDAWRPVATDAIDSDDEPATQVALRPRSAPAFSVRAGQPVPIAVLSDRVGLGGRLAARLRQAGHPVRVIDEDLDARDLSRALSQQAVVLDLYDPRRRPDGLQVAAEEARGRLLANAADRAGVRRILCLGPLVDDAALHRAPAMLFARVAGAIELATGPVPVTELRVGPLLRPDGFLVRLLKAAAQLPLRTPRGVARTRIQPVAEADLAKVVARLVARPDELPRLVELGGPEIVELDELIRRTHDGLDAAGRWPRAVPWSVVPSYATLLALKARVQHAVTLQLLDAARVDMIVRDREVSTTFEDLLTTPLDHAMGTPSRGAARPER